MEQYLSLEGSYYMANLGYGLASPIRILWCLYFHNERTNWQMAHKKLENTLHSPSFNYIKINIIM
jgi:hypothetical protein